MDGYHAHDKHSQQNRETLHVAQMTMNRDGDIPFDIAMTVLPLVLVVARFYTDTVSYIPAQDADQTTYNKTLGSPKVC